MVSLSAYSNLEHEELKQRIQLEVVHSTGNRCVGFKKSLYRETVQMHAFVPKYASNGHPEVVTFIIHYMTPL